MVTGHDMWKASIISVSKRTVKGEMDSSFGHDISFHSFIGEIMYACKFYLFGFYLNR